MSKKANASVSETPRASYFGDVLKAEGMTPPVIAQFRKIILSFYKKNARDLPWRHTDDPYHILVSEVMLQQTQVGRVVKKYPEFTAAFPTCSTLASAPLISVLTVWQGMGYNRRAIALLECARRIESDFAGRVPEDVHDLESLPGIGKATARSILAFAYNRPEVFIETNIRRVFIHFFFTGRQGISDNEILPLVKKTLDEDDPRIWYSALMDYGTFLKTSELNPNRRSAQYTRQSEFKGSDRQIRGSILKKLIQYRDVEEKDLILKVGFSNPDRVPRIINSLVAEGFCERIGSRVRILHEHKS